MSIRQVQGIDRLGRLLRKWHGIELFLSDSCGNIQDVFETSWGEAFSREIVQKTEELKNSTQGKAIFNSQGILGVALLDKGLFRGAVWGRLLPGWELSPKKAEYLGELLAWVGDEIEHPDTLNNKVEKKYRYHSMVGKSRKMQEVYDLLKKISTSEASVFIQGANGTGKELVARAIHKDSPRRNKIFLAVNCSAFNENLLDSELFGHVRGAFTGAIKSKKGLFEQADGGTLFLDEVGDTSLSMQVKLLRVLQEGTYLPVGANSPRKCNVRIIASTNRPIEEMMLEGKFREDLYYRLNVININLPPLKDRTEDIPLLVEHFMEMRCRDLDVPLKKLSKDAMEKIFDYEWPGNVRELQNELERLVVLAGDGQAISSRLLAPKISSYPPLTLVQGGGELETSGKLRDVIEKVERRMIQEGLRRCSFNKSQLARELGISRANLIAKVYKYGLEERPVRLRAVA